MSTHSASGPAAGIIFQFERVLYRLATSNAGSVVGIETDDDVVVRSGIDTTLEQDKHSIQEGVTHPFADRSIHLWKSLAIWAEATLKGYPFDAASLCLVTNKAVPKCFAKRLGAEQKSPQEIRELTRELRAIGGSISGGVRRFADVVLALPEPILEALIRRVSIHDVGSLPGGGSLSQATISALHIPKHVDGEAVLQRLKGWIQEFVMDKWLRGEPAWITRDSFTSQKFVAEKEVHRQRVLGRAERVIRITEDDRREARQGHFVEHLALIACCEDDVDRAVDDFCRFKVEYSRLVEEGDVGMDDWMQRADRLVRRWERIFRRNKEGVQSASPEDVGLRILRDVVDSGHLESLAGYETVEEYLTAGHYHRLADSDDVWWHPDFEKG